MRKGQTHEENTQVGWKLDRTISPANLIALLILTLAFARWTAAIEQSVKQNETVISHIISKQIEEKERVDVLRAEFKSDLSGINAKLDRLIETQYKR